MWRKLHAFGVSVGAVALSHIQLLTHTQCVQPNTCFYMKHVDPPVSHLLLVLQGMSVPVCWLGLNDVSDLLAGPAWCM
jgi:hypothetical protein